MDLHRRVKHAVVVKCTMLTEESGAPASQELRVLEPGDLDAAVAVLCSAFTGDTLLGWACGDRAARAMPLGFRLTTGLLLAARSVHGYFEGRDLVGVLLVQTPDAKLSIRAGLGSGLLELPFRAGLRGATRLVRTFLETEKFKQEVMGGEPFIYLDTVGVRLDRTGHGIGTRLLNGVMRELARTRSEPLLLLTHTARNIAYYERLGFVVRGTHPLAGSPLTFAAMSRRLPTA